MNFDQAVSKVLEQQFNDSWPMTMLNKAWGMVGHPGLPAHYQKAKEAGMLETDSDGKVRIKPEFYSQSSASTTQSTTSDTAPLPKPNTTTTTANVDFNAPGFSTQSFDQSMQQMEQSNPTFNGQAYGDWAKGVVKGMMESERVAGRSQEQMQKVFQEELQRYVQMAPQYVNQFQKQPGQQQSNYTANYMTPQGTPHQQMMQQQSAQFAKELDEFNKKHQQGSYKPGGWAQPIGSATKSY